VNECSEVIYGHRDVRQLLRGGHGCLPQDEWSSEGRWRVVLVAVQEKVESRKILNEHRDLPTESIGFGFGAVDVHLREGETVGFR